MGVIDDIKEGVKKELEMDKVEAEQQKTGVLDVLSEKVMSRKLLVWVVASCMLFADKLQSDDWVAISLGYIGIQGVADLAAKWKGAKNG